MSLIDYEGYMTTVVFIEGCNLRCPYCHNPELVYAKEEDSVESIMEEIKNRDVIGIEAVTITGGEPTTYTHILDLCKAIKSEGYRLKLDSNGTNPEVLESLIPYTDYIAMDIKTDLERYKDLGLADTDDLIECIDIVMNSGKAYEFRTTGVNPFIRGTNCDRIGKLIDGAEVWYLQEARLDNVLNPSYRMKKLTKSKTKEILETMSKYVDKVKLREYDD